MKKINKITYSKFVKSIKKDANGIYVETIFGQVLRVPIEEFESEDFDDGDIIEHDGEIYLVKSKNIIVGRKRIYC